jgi:capsular exopolysaccharide synthesis family protein
MRLLRKHILWLIAATMAGIVGAVLIHISLPVHYVSAAEVDVEPNTAALTIAYAPNMVTEQQVATSGVVLADAASALGTTPAALEKDLSASVSGTDATGGTANVLSINCAMSTAINAQRCAAAATSAYMAFRNDANQPKSIRAHDPISVTLVTPATLPTKPTGVGLRILLPIGAVLGLLLGIATVFVRDHFDRRVRDRADLERLLGAPVLASIPLGWHSDDVFIRRPLSATAESYRFLREHLNSLARVAEGGAVVLVAGAKTDDGCTSVAANLAVALAEPGARVLLVDADLWHPSLSAVFDAGRRPGWSDLLAGRASLDEVAIPVPQVPGLRLVTAGYTTVKAADIFRDASLVQAFRAMRAQADVIVVDSAPLLEVSHTIALARASDIVALVADVRRTNQEDIAEAAQQIRATGQQAIVGVLNGVPSPVNGRQARPAHAREGALTPVAEVPAILAGSVPPRGPNGKHRNQFGAAHVYPRDRGDTGTDADDGPGPGEVQQ